MKASMSLLLKQAFQALADATCVVSAYYCSLLLRFGGQITPEYQKVFFDTVALFAIIFVFVFYVFGLYRSLWHNTGIDEIIKIAAANIVASVINYFVTSFLYKALPLSIYIAASLIAVLLISFLHMSYRIGRRFIYSFAADKYQLALIFGAGELGTYIIRYLKESSNTKIKPVIVIDDDPKKQGLWIRGVRVVGTRWDLARMVKKYAIDVILFCASTAANSEKRAILNLCMETGCAVKVVPGMHDLFGDTSNAALFRDIEMVDLLGRSEIKLETSQISKNILNQCVLVTGGGGSIGSELCRQIAKYAPKKVVVFDIYENNAYDLLMELSTTHPELQVCIEIGSIRDEKRLDEVFEKHLPEIVFHAAAHKHVPLMETNPDEAIKNNIFGTLKVAMAADKVGVRTFVLISTDKAVNPSNVMGATKRMAEYVIKYLNSYSKTKFMAVRFGNVLGSSGSVIPLFKRQITQGGPVTVTHKDMTRYFMTIPEAASLVLQAASVAQKGELFVLNMGEPVRIDDIARTLIKLAGCVPEKDIEIRYTGLRPGEKINEELFYEEESLSVSAADGISIVYSKCNKPALIKSCLDYLERKLNESADMRVCLHEVLDTLNGQDEDTIPSTLGQEQVLG